MTPISRGEILIGVTATVAVAGFPPGCCRSTQACKRSRAASMPRRQSLGRQTSWQARYGARQPPTTSSRNITGSSTQTGRTGTQRTWRRSGRAPSRRCEWLRETTFAPSKITPPGFRVLDLFSKGVTMAAPGSLLVVRTRQGADLSACTDAVSEIGRADIEWCAPLASQAAPGRGATR